MRCAFLDVALPALEALPQPAQSRFCASRAGAGQLSHISSAKNARVLRSHDVEASRFQTDPPNR